MKNKNTRSVNIDVLKGLAIISVILLHTYDGFLLLGIGAPLHIWQAVPVFMILQGYNNTNSYLRRGFRELEDFLNIKYFMKKFNRLLFPYIVFFILQTIFLKITDPVYFSSISIIERFLTGGRGPGSYFVPLSIQTQLLLPLIFLFMKKNTEVRLAIVFLISVLLEVLSLKLPIEEDLYRILLIRFIFALALGVALAILKSDFFNTTLFKILTITSAIYIIGVMYFDWDFIMEKFWHSQHAPGFFWPLFIIIFFEQLKLSPNNKMINALSIFGKASYHIFLVQLFYFWKPISEETPNLPTIFDSLVNVVVCVVLGLIFFELEQKFWKKIKK